MKKNCASSWLFIKIIPRCFWNVMAHAQKPDFVFRRNGRVYLNRQGRQFSRLLAAEVCASAVVMLDTPCSEVVWRVLATISIRHFPLHFPSSASPCAITYQLDSTTPWLLYPWKRDPLRIVQRAGWALGPAYISTENLASTGIRTADRPACSKSQYRNCPQYRMYEA